VSDVNERPGPTTTRAYRSTLRDEGALETRRRILAAAHALFLEQGYARTSITDLATRAGVARPTVLSVFGSKAALLQSVVDVAMAGTDAPVPVAQQPWFRPVWSATTTPEMLDAYAHACRLIGRRSAGVIELVRRASDEGDDLAALWDRLQANRRHGAGTIAAQARRLGGMRAGLSVRRAGDELFVLNDSGHYLTLVTERGWSEAAYVRWLASAMRHTLLG
jgi:AcrR family transcriptional regulator